MENYTITEEQIKELAKGNAKVKKWFPEVFETKLEAGKWYVVENIKDGSLAFCGIGMFTEENSRCGLLNTEIGFNFKQPNGQIWRTDGNIRLATEEEVFEALKNEAVKRGLLGSYIEKIKGYKGQISSEKTNTKPFLQNGELIVGSKFGTYTLFSKGVWAKSIQTLTKKEAEKKLNVKIIE